MSGNNGGNVKPSINTGENKNLTGNNINNSIDNTVIENNQQENEIIENIELEESKLINANLENLAIEKITIVPEFSPEITEYKIELENEISQLNILAVPQNINANVTINGNKDLKVGENIIDIVVVSEDGSNTKKYTIVANKKEKIEENVESEEELVQNKNRFNKIYLILIPVLIILIIIILSIIYFNSEKKKRH